MVSAKDLDWDTILQEVAIQDREKVKVMIVSYHLDLFVDGSHQVVFLEDILRFKPNQLISHLVNSKQINLNQLMVDFNDDKFDLYSFRMFNRDMGYSLAAYTELSINREE